MKTKILLSSLVALFGFTFFSCATTDNSTAQSQPAPSASASAPSPAAAAPDPNDPYAKFKNLALGKSVISNGHIYSFTADNAVDGEVLSYWEGPADSYPNEFTVDLGSKKPFHAVRIMLNPKSIWEERTQHIEIQTSDDGTTFAPAVAATDYVFTPGKDSKNTVTIPLEGSARYVKLIFTANTASNAGQMAELQILGD